MYSKRRQNLESKSSLFLRRRWRKSGAWLVLAVFFFNALAPLWLAGLGFAGLSSANSATGLQDESVVVICTANGLKLVRFNGDGEPIPNGASDDGFCVLCLPVYSVNAIAPDISQPVPQPELLASGPPATIDAGLFRPAVSSGSASPRAPPASI